MGVLFVVLVIVLAVFSSKHKQIESGTGQASDISADAASADDNSPIPVTTEALKEDAYPEVNALVTTYFTAVASGDVTTLESIISSLSDEAEIRIIKKAEYTEGYDSIKCYTKPGPVADSYLVFAYYQLKFKNIDTKAPGLSALYVCTREDGSLYIYNDDLPQNVSDYINAVRAQDDVVALLKKVDDEYDTVLAGDKTLKAFSDALPTKLDEEVAAELAKGTDAASLSGNSASVDSASTEVQVTTTDAVNIRSAADDSDSNNIIAKSAKGDTFTRIGEEGEWSKIKYKDTTAYIKSEYLTTSTGTADAANTADTADTANAAAADTTTTTDTDNGGNAASGKVTIKESVRIRSSMSTDGTDNVIGHAYKGDSFTLEQEMADGWYKIDYKGKTGYVKTDYATKD